MYEHKKQPLAPVAVFRRRLLLNALYMAMLLGFSLIIGVVGYKYTCDYSWIDSLLNASMILGGMGPIPPVNAPDMPVWGKIFASAYAIFCGVTLLTSIGVLFTPVLHRIYHWFHAADEEGEEAEENEEDNIKRKSSPKVATKGKK